MAGDREDIARVTGDFTEVAGDRIIAGYVFGSRLSVSAPAADSALDLVLVVDDYRLFYEEIRRAGLVSRSPRLLAALNRRLPPNVLHYLPHEVRVGAEPTATGAARGRNAKIVVITEPDLAAALGRGARDHFMLGRFSQRLAIVAVKGEAEGTRALAYHAVAVRRTLDWAGPYMEARFSPAGFSRRMLEVSYAAEIRPESPLRAGEVHEAQRAFFEDVYGELFCEEEARGRLVDDGGGMYRFAEPPGPGERAARDAYFRRSRRRATLRWLKYMITFEGWADYIVRKIERRTGRPVRLTALERRAPLLFGLPRAIQVLATLRRDARRAGVE